MSHKEIEEGDQLQLDYQKLRRVAECGEDVLPAVAQDGDTGEVLIVGYANELALKTTQKLKMATFWSTSRNELWIKGKTSGDYLEILEIRVNCEQNSIFHIDHNPNLQDEPLVESFGWVGLVVVLVDHLHYHLVHLQMGASEV